ncbi:hypothetical protein [Trichloromonas sp.]|uniref:hypothetical protein n=1 Tax=Trichloromonas sp. TaxID=3069249 RepID=UPI003D815B72
MLPDNLRQHWDDADELYGVILSALNDEMFAEVLEAARHLHAIDTLPERGACFFLAP